MSFSPLWPATPPPSFISHFARGEVELVVHDQDLRRRDAEEARERADRAAGHVHVGRRLDEAQVAGLRDRAAKPASPRTTRRALARQRVDEPEAGVVARARRSSRPGLPRPATRRIGAAMGQRARACGRPAKRARGCDCARASSRRRRFLFLLSSFLLLFLLSFGGRLRAQRPDAAPAAAAASAAGASSVSTMAFGTTAVAITGSLPCVSATTPGGSLMPETCSDLRGARARTGRPR